jgi:competence protein ComEA
MVTGRRKSLLLSILALTLLVLPGLAAPSPETADSAKEPPRVDINTAGVEELQSLPGIGPALAKRIVEHRQQNGPFRRVEDLLEIQGIGEKSLARMRDRLTVSQAKKG